MGVLINWPRQIFLRCYDSQKQKTVVHSIGKLSQFHYVGCTLHACWKTRSPLTCFHLNGGVVSHNPVYLLATFFTTSPLLIYRDTAWRGGWSNPEVVVSYITHSMHLWIAPAKVWSLGLKSAILALSKLKSTFIGHVSKHRILLQFKF